MDFGCFKRDVFLFKNISLLQLFFLVLWSIVDGKSLFDVSLQSYGEFFFQKVSEVSVAMIVGGFALSVKATLVLGFDGTYFGSELGHCPIIRVSEFPYG